MFIVAFQGRDSQSLLRGYHTGWAYTAAHLALLPQNALQNHVVRPVYKYHGSIFDLCASGGTLLALHASILELRVTACGCGEQEQLLTLPGSS